MASATTSASNSRAQSHIRSLAARHSEVEAQLHELSHHPSVNDIEIRKLKRLKLKLKDQIEAH